jgi:uncharacterized membrane protein YagU involved in acid resistance
VAKRSPATAILTAGLLAGALDLIAAFALSASRGGGPVQTLQGIATGVLGRASYSAGAASAALGFICHFTIALGAAVTYYMASRRLKFLTSQAVPTGILFGIAVYFFMQHVVLPLSAFPGRPASQLSTIATGVVIHIFCVGLPIALVIRWAR